MAIPARRCAASVGAAPPARTSRRQASSRANSATAWVISDAPVPSTQGEVAISPATSSARSRDTAAAKTPWASSTEAPVSTGFTSQGAPASTPSARTAGHPGAVTGSHSVPRTANR